MSRVSFYRKDNVYLTVMNPNSKTKDKEWMRKELIKRHQLRQELKRALEN